MTGPYRSNTRPPGITLDTARRVIGIAHALNSAALVGACASHVAVHSLIGIVSPAASGLGVLYVVCCLVGAAASAWQARRYLRRRTR